MANIQVAGTVQDARAPNAPDRKEPGCFSYCCALFGVSLLLPFLLVIVCALWDYWSPRNLLPKDEEMIVNFREHRADFEEIVRITRTFDEWERKGITWPTRDKKVKRLMQQAGISAINPYTVLWLPDPYTSTTGKQREKMWELCRDDWQQWSAIDETAREHLFPPKCRLNTHKFGELQIEPEHDKFWKVTWRYGRIWKTWQHFPEVPKIEEGHLLYPINAWGEIHPQVRVVTSLNSFPPNWRRGECVYRQIELQWFIAMCRGH